MFGKSNPWYRLPLFDRDSGGAPGGGNGNPPANNGNPGGGGNEPPADELADFWNSEDNSNGGNPTPQNNQQQQPQQQPQNHNEQLANLINSRIPRFEMDQEAADAFKNGDLEGFQASLHKQFAGVYQNMLGDVNKLIQGMKQSIVDEAVSKSGTQVNARQAVATMHEKLPWTADPVIAPVAQAALSQAIKKGKSVTEAIDLIPKFFNRASEKMQGNKRSNSASGYNRGNGGVNNNGNTDDGGEENFLELLGAGN